MTTAASPSGLPPLSITARQEEHDNVRIVTLTVMGEVDLAGEPQFQRDLALAIGDGPDLLIIDLTGTTFLTSIGLAALARTHFDALPRTAVRIVPGPHLRTLQRTALDQLLALYPTVADARTDTPAGS